MQLEFRIQGSSEEPYLIVFTREGGSVYATCSCAAGEMQQACKHRIALMNGEISSLTSANTEDVAILRSMMVGTALQSSYDKVLAAQDEVAAAKKRLSGAKHAFSRTMHR